MNKVKIGILGIGNVGCHVLYTLALLGLGDIFVLIDIDEKKANAERQDVFDTAQYLPHSIRLKIGSYEDLEDADIIICSVGNIKLLRETNDRMTELKFNIPAVRSCAKKIAEVGFNGILINISNPCDVVTNEFASILNLPEGHVFGTGTGLDTSRLRAYLADICGVSADSIQGYMLGEHGASQFPAWSVLNINGMPLNELARIDARFAFDRTKAEEKTREGGWTVLNGKGHTDYGIAMTTANIVRAVIHDQKKVMPVSVHLTGQYGESGLFAGLPAIIGANGVEQVIELPITENERLRFSQSCRYIQDKITLAAAL